MQNVVSACLALMLAVFAPSVAAASQEPSQAVMLQIVITPVGVTDELALRDGTRAYGRVAPPKTQIELGIVIHPLRVCDHFRASAHSKNARRLQELL